MISSVPKSMQVAFKFAREQTAHYSKSFFLSSQMLPKERRWATYALYSFCRYADNLIDNPRERSAEELITEVNGVADELRIAYKCGESEHPILKPYMAVAMKYDIPIEYALDLLEGVKMDVNRNRYETWDDLYVFCYRVAGVVGLMMTHVLGYKSREAFQYAEKLGIAMQMTNILRDVKEDAHRGRIYLPLDEMARFGVSESDILSLRMTPQMEELMRFQVERAQNYYREANPGISLLSRKSQFAIYSASKIYGGILNKIEHNSFDPFKGRVYVKQSHKFGILLQELLKTRVAPIFQPEMASSPQLANQ